MNVRADRTTEHSLTTVGYDEGWRQSPGSWCATVPCRHPDRPADRLARRAHPVRRCAYIDSFRHLPVQRMPNVSLLPAAGGPTTEKLVGDVRDGLYVVGDDSWSIDMQRCTFQFTGQRFHRIRGDRVVGPVRDAAYQGLHP